MTFLNGLIRLFVLLLIPCLVYTLRAGTAQPEQLALASGKQVPLLSENRAGQNDASLLVRYQSGLSFDQPSSVALGQEAEQVLGAVETRPSATGCTQIILNVNEAPQGFLSTSRNRNFIFNRDSKGSWQRDNTPDSQE